MAQGSTEGDQNHKQWIAVLNLPPCLTSKIVFMDGEHSYCHFKHGAKCLFTDIQSTSTYSIQIDHILPQVMDVVGFTKNNHNKNKHKQSCQEMLFSFQSAMHNVALFLPWTVENTAWVLKHVKQRTDTQLNDLTVITLPNFHLQWYSILTDRCKSSHK